MCTLWSFWLFLPLPAIAQNPLPTNAPQAQKPAAAAAKTDPKADPKAPPKFEDDPDSEIDKFVKQQAEKLDKIVDASADLVYAVRNQDQFLETKGVYKLGAQNRMRFELTFAVGKLTGKRLYVSDGVDAYHVNEFGDRREGQHFKLEKILPILQDKSMPADDANMVTGAIVPFRRPGDMLRGYLARITFTERKDDKLGDRAVVRLEGRLKKSAVALLHRGDAKKGFDDLAEDFPRYLSLVLDKETGWPLQMELFQKHLDIGIFKPVLSMKFSKLVIGQRVPESEFKFTPPANTNIQDVTPTLEAGLKRKREAMQAQAEANKAGKKDAAPDSKDGKKPDATPPK